MNRSKSIVLGATRIILYNSIDTDERRSGRKTCKHVVGKINTHRPHHARVAVDKSDIELIDTLPRGEVQPDTKSETSWWRRRYRSDRVHINTRNRRIRQIASWGDGGLHASWKAQGR